MSKKEVLDLIEKNWELALLSFYNVKNKDEAYFLDSISNFETFDARDFSDYAETIRMPLDDATLEIHADVTPKYGFVYLFAPYSGEENIIAEAEFSRRSKASLNVAIRFILEAYFEYKQEV